MKKIILLLMTAILMLSLTACGSTEPKQNGVDAEGNQAASENNQKEFTKITVSEPVRSELWGPAYLAKTLGYFEDEGLDVEFVTVQGDMPTAPVLSGDAQFGLYGPEMILSFNEKGQGTKLIATVSDRYPYSFVTSKDITDIKQLKGSVLCAGDSGSSPRAFVRSIAASAGLDPDKDVTYVNIPGAASIAALEKNEIQGTYISPTARAIALKSGFNLLIDIYDPAVHSKLIGSDSYEMYIIFSSDKYIKENPETVQAFTNAVYKAILWADSHSAEEIVESLTPLFANSKTLPTAVAEIKENGIWSSDGQFSDNGYDAINRVALSSGLIKAPVKRDAAVDDTFIENAHKNVK